VTAFEQLLIDTLDGIKADVKACSDALSKHAETDREAFSAIQSSVDAMLTDHHVRSAVAKEQGGKAGSASGRLWAIIGTVIGTIISTLIASGSVAR